MNSKAHPSRVRKIAFRVATIILIVGMFFGGLSQVFGAEVPRNLFMQLGYPLYLMTIVGVSKTAAAIVLILLRVPLLKVSAYTGLVNRYNHFIQPKVSHRRNVHFK